MTPTENVLVPKTKQQLYDDIKHMELYAFLSVFRKKSLLRVRGVSFGKRLAHAFLHYGDNIYRIFVVFILMTIIGAAWNIIFPYSSMRQLGF